MTLPAGRISVLVGPGGSGKTTFVKALLGEPVSGIWWRANKVELPGPHYRAQWQAPASSRKPLGALLAPPETLGEQVPAEACRVLRSVWPGDSPVRGMLAPNVETPLDELPAWYPRLAAFTAAIAVPASLYVFDEPDADLPTEAIEPLAERILRLAPRATVLLVTHHLQLARRVGDYLVLMIDGEIVEADESRGFFNHPTRARTREFVRLGC